MQTIEEKIKQIEEEIRKTPYHKGTEHYIGRLKARIARLKEERLERNFKKTRGSGEGFAARKTGDATVVLVGPPGVGKSTLINKLTNAESKVAPYDFTTLGVVPGMLDYKGAKIQIFDVPGIISGAASGKGRGKEILSVARSADLILVMVDVRTASFIPSILKELNDAGLRLNEQKPNITINKKLSGGIKVNAVTKLTLGYDTVKSLASEFRLTNAEIIIKENVSLDALVDAFVGNRVYLPFLTIINKIDLGVAENLEEYLPYEVELVKVSAETSENLDYLSEKIWQALNFIRVYLKKGGKIDYGSPFIAKKGADLKSLLEKMTIPNKEKFKFAKVFGPKAKYSGQEVSLNFVPQDETIIQFV